MCCALVVHEFEQVNAKFEHVGADLCAHSVIAPSKLGIKRNNIHRAVGVDSRGGEGASPP